MGSAHTDGSRHPGAVPCPEVLASESSGSPSCGHGDLDELPRALGAIRLFVQARHRSSCSSTPPPAPKTSLKLGFSYYSRKPSSTHMSSYNVAEFRNLVQRAKVASEPEFKLALSKVAQKRRSNWATRRRVRRTSLSYKKVAPADKRQWKRRNCALPACWIARTTSTSLAICFGWLVAAQDAIKLARQVEDLRWSAKKPHHFGYFSGRYRLHYSSR
jgi:hypothetical protein